MAGGIGARFWPASRTARPKQLLRLVGDRTMIQDTVDRLSDLVPDERILIVTNQALVEPIAEQLPTLDKTSIIGEPCKRDTAPCICLAAALIQRTDPDATMVIMPADRAIQTPNRFRDAVRRATALVEEHPSQLITFGIKPTFPSESYGYIERGESLADHEDVFRVEMFREKPSVEIAEQYLASGNFYWNAGIFVWKAAAILQALERFEPDMVGHIQTIVESHGTAEFSQVLETEFTAIEGKSIDYAVMEKHQEVVVIEAPFDWDDVGNWQSLARMRKSDDDGNTVQGKHLSVNSRGCIVSSQDDHLIVTLGVEDCIVVHTPDATLVAHKHDEEAIRQIVQQLREKGWREYL
jgi:mannose-1-phosphate guanylyltransferase